MLRKSEHGHGTSYSSSFGVCRSLFLVFSFSFPHSLSRSAFSHPDRPFLKPFVDYFPCWPYGTILLRPRRSRRTNEKRTDSLFRFFSFSFFFVHYNTTPSPPLRQERDHALGKNVFLWSASFLGGLFSRFFFLSSVHSTFSFRSFRERRPETPSLRQAIRL